MKDGACEAQLWSLTTKKDGRRQNWEKQVYQCGGNKRPLQPQSEQEIKDFVQNTYLLEISYIFINKLVIFKRAWQAWIVILLHWA